ncbi:hypothetical protein BpHYR1_014289 [Brachionus plicatilis]|uniref:Uncharacterized protein n=1 Tax=Brachionus plicatilis TaxID=10195 RepID=A0A3M7R5K8_BRAPC|nr:hypothetical protein BpHYR1_014289 [Brachionus plicatilis]
MIKKYTNRIDYDKGTSLLINLEIEIGTDPWFRDSVYKGFLLFNILIVYTSLYQPECPIL